jgi:ATP/maltotriose-dependent transcriptional regulator MalT
MTLPALAQRSFNRPRRGLPGPPRNGRRRRPFITPEAHHAAEAAAKQGIARNYVRRLLAAVNKTGDSMPSSQALIEPLSERELDVLRLLGTDLDGPDIARQLVVSLNTMRTHTKNIYAKLGVNNRRAAVRRAGELGLSRTGDRQPRRAVVRDP